MFHASAFGLLDFLKRIEEGAGLFKQFVEDVLSVYIPV